MAGGFFFEQKTAYEMRISDWSSAVCSSDLQVELVLDELSSLQDNLMALDVVLNMQLRKDQAAHLGVLATEYETAFSEVVQVIAQRNRSEEHTSELQSLMRISYAVFCLKKKKKTSYNHNKKHTKQ